VPRAAAVLLIALPLHAQLTGVFSAQSDHPAIQYASRPVRDPVSRLNQRIRTGTAQLKFSGRSGYLRSVLEALDVPVTSQLAVFAKNSLQARIISPQNPRTIFFNDSVSIAWVPGEPFVEAASTDPEQGVIFYTLTQTPVDQPQFTRSDGPCLSCHENYSSLGVPGMLLRSVFPAPTGQPIRTMGDFNPDHRTAHEQRWGGWFVTGNAGTLRHMGNSIMNAESPSTISPRLDSDVYLSTSSDVVALMVFGHQMHMTNLLTRLNWELRLAAYEHKPFDMAGAAKEVVDYMTFVDESPLPNRIQGTSGFAEEFAAKGPRDHRGRSLREFDLQSRLMRYRCSYMIYSEAFDALPPAARQAIYQRMRKTLPPPTIEILRDTRKDFADH